MINRSELGKRLRELRNEKHLSSLTVSQKIGISRSTLQMYEAGERFPKDEIKVKLADFYGLTVQELFFSPVLSRLSRGVTSKEAS